MKQGVIYKFTKNLVVIRPDEFGPVRKDVLFDRTKEYRLGDRVEYEQIEKNGRRYAVNLKKI
jgi:hypothetical protein